jgi:hypothetical protein
MSSLLMAVSAIDKSGQALAPKRYIARALFCYGEQSHMVAGQASVDVWLA